MPERVAFPFHVLPDSVVDDTVWMVGPAGEPLHPVTDFLDYWDYAQDLDVMCQFQIDMQTTAENLELTPDDLHIRAILSIGTGQGMMPRTLWMADAKDLGPSGEITLQSSVQSIHLSGRLWLEAELVLWGKPDSPGPLSPRESGSKLWNSKRDILLEDGGSARFPVEALDFSCLLRGRAHKGSPWFLDWQPDRWNRDFSGAVRLYLNRERPDIIALVDKGDPFTMQMILSDVMNQVVVAALLEDDWSMLEECDEGTLGRQALDWIEMAFPNTDVATVSSILEERPGEFHASICQAAEMGTNP